LGVAAAYPKLGAVGDGWRVSRCGLSRNGPELEFLGDLVDKALSVKSSRFATKPGN
jgi:hypothetical protein